MPFIIWSQACAGRSTHQFSYMWRIRRQWKCLERFFSMLHNDQDCAYYDFEHIIRANFNTAIETLMISDARDISQRVANTLH
ncbi:eRF1 domain 3 [Plasmopara halstedii]|uniref:ERF1 domain 3 n=1 Tax=Plasmopara halstedii TaxID=4781 RepID=A0A0N7L5U8_PLAHL|nr:eRF1 domain 3 [Plasmopara halstedii]CEG42475.1 eRF1 domain 3 [Plasmopara halstedii]|eukprot:XP_024578844.1 eRF1 domain 3 [Plasmopara halstedii]